MTHWKTKVARGFSLSVAAVSVGCGAKLDFGENTKALSSQLKLFYLDPINSNNEVEIGYGATFPALVSSTGAGRFDLRTNCPSTFDVDYEFVIKNTGEGILYATNSPVVTVTKKTDYTSGIISGTAGDRTFSITAQPSLPLGPGASTTFTLRMSNADNNRCALGASDPAATSDSWEVVSILINATGTLNTGFSAELNMFGGS